eukprot:1150478-Pelagomonas_calceolata.AAC.15
MGLGGGGQAAFKKARHMSGPTADPLSDDYIQPFPAEKVSVVPGVAKWLFVDLPLQKDTSIMSGSIRGAYLRQENNFCMLTAWAYPNCKGCQMSTMTMALAAKVNSIRCMNLAYKRGCPVAGPSTVAL